MDVPGVRGSRWVRSITRVRPAAPSTRSACPTTCFSRAFIRYGEPIDITGYREQYEASPMRAIRSLTNVLTERMEGLLIQTKNKAEEHLLRPIERAIQNERPLTVSKHHYRTQKILTALREMPDEQREAHVAEFWPSDPLGRRNGS